MKIFISADIEGCAGLSFTDETHKNESVYQRYAEEMTNEVVAVCEAAHAAGATAIVVKDGHGDASNINPLAMPEYVTLIRGKSGHPYNMMFGLDETFDGVFFLGYHAAAGNPEFAISHTSTGNSQYIRLNGRYMSEFMLNTYTASSLGIPVLFLSGDEAVCRDARELAPQISTAEIKRGVGGATYGSKRKGQKKSVGKESHGNTLLDKYDLKLSGFHNPANGHHARIGTAGNRHRPDLYLRGG